MKFRSELKNDILCALSSCKFNQTCNCIEYSPTYDVLKAANQATVEYDKSLQSGLIMVYHCPSVRPSSTLWTITQHFHQLL